MEPSTAKGPPSKTEGRAGGSAGSSLGVSDCLDADVLTLGSAPSEGEGNDGHFKGKAVGAAEESSAQETEGSGSKAEAKGKRKGKGKGKKGKTAGEGDAAAGPDEEVDAGDPNGSGAGSSGQPSLLEGLPPLPRLPVGQRSSSWARGPHETCNYVLPGRLLAGSYPGDRSEPGHSRKILSCLEAGVNTFVCLQERQELQRFTPYVARAKELHAGLDGAQEGDLEVLSCEIPDTSVTSRHSLAIALATVVHRLRQGRVLYVHCWGGHGRTGTLLCAFLVRAYGLSVEEAKDFFMATHSQRQVTGGGGPGHWPHSRQQYDQARSFEGDDSELVDERLGPLEEW